MRQLVLSLVVVMCAITGAAQFAPYQSMLQEGRKYVNFMNVRGHPDYGDYSYNYTFYLHGDSVVNGRTYKCCYIIVNDEVASRPVKCGSKLPQMGSLCSLLREENMVLYALKTDDLLDVQMMTSDGYNQETGEYILYNFASARESVEAGSGSASIVEVDGHSCNLLKGWWGEFLESVGRVDSYGTLLAVGWGIANCRPNNVSGLSHVINADGEIIYKSKYYKEELSGIDDVIESNTDYNDNNYYDLQGRIVDIKSAQPGIYIHHGKKYTLQ